MSERSINLEGLNNLFSAVMADHDKLGPKADVLEQDEIDALLRDMGDSEKRSSPSNYVSYEQVQLFLQMSDVAFLLIQLTATNLTVQRMNEILHELVRKAIEHFNN
jgi:hypothetical protein